MTSGQPGIYLKASRTKSMFPRAPKHSRCNQRDTHYFCCLSERAGGSGIATEGGTEGVFLCTTVCLGQRMLQVKRQGCHRLSHALKTTWSGTKRHRENHHWRGILSPLNGLGFVSSGIKELITEAEFLKWQPCPVRASLL